MPEIILKIYMGTINSTILHGMTEVDIKLKRNGHFQTYHDMPCAQLGLYLILAKQFAKKCTVQIQHGLGWESELKCQNILLLKY